MPDQPEATVLSLLVDAMREVKESVTQLSRDLNQQLSKMPTAYVPRQEVRQWVDDVIGDARQERQERKDEVAELKASIAAVEERRRSDRWQTITAVLSLAGLGLTSLALVISHWS